MQNKESWKWERRKYDVSQVCRIWVSLNQGVQGSNPWSRTRESLFLTAANVGGGGFFLRKYAVFGT